MTAARRARAAALARRLAWAAFVALVVLSPLRARVSLSSRPVVPVYGDYTDFLLFWSDVALLAVLAMWGLSLALERRPVRFGPRFLAWPAAALLGAAWAGVPFSVDAGLGAYAALRLTVLAALAVWILNEVDGFDRLVMPATLMITVQAVVGVGQVITQRSLGLGVLGENTLATSMGVSVVTADDGTRLLRAYALSDHPNILGGVLAMAVLLVAGTAAVTARRLSPWRAAAVALGGVTLLLTFSRGAWIGLAAGLVVLVGMLAVAGDRAGLRRVAAVCACGLVVATPFMVPYKTALAARTGTSAPSSTEQRSVDERMALVDETIPIVRAHPLLGTGAGTLPEAEHAADPGFRYQYQPASVVLLDVTAETGFVGGIAYLVILLAPWVALWRSRPRWTAELAVASGLLATLTVVGLFDHYTWSSAPGRFWTGLVVAMWAVAHRRAVAGTPDAA